MRSTASPNLRDADLREACLDGAKLYDGRTYEEWRADPLVGLCDDAESRARAIGAWERAGWNTCPMHAAHGWTSMEDAGPLRDLVACFVALHDSWLLPVPEIGQ